MLTYKSRNLQTSEWEKYYLTHCTQFSLRFVHPPHERLFNYQRRSTSGQAIPSWLSTPGPVLLKRHVRNSKYDPLVDEAELIEANPQYAHVRLCNGRETTVSLRDLAPYSPIAENHDTPVATTPTVVDDVADDAVGDVSERESGIAGTSEDNVRRSSRASKPRDRLIEKM